MKSNFSIMSILFATFLFASCSSAIVETPPLLFSSKDSSVKTSTDNLEELILKLGMTLQVERGLLEKMVLIMTELPPMFSMEEQQESNLPPHPYWKVAGEVEILLLSCEASLVIAEHYRSKILDSLKVHQPGFSNIFEEVNPLLHSYVRSGWELEKLRLEDGLAQKKKALEEECSRLKSKINPFFGEIIELNLENIFFLFTKLEVYWLALAQEKKNLEEYLAFNN